MRETLLKLVINYMKKNGIPLGKIVIQKALFFLKETGNPVPYRFNAYTYGPYSQELAQDLNNLCFWDVLKEGEGAEGVYSLKKEIAIELDPDLEGRVKDLESRVKDLESRVNSGLRNFTELAQGEFGFEKMETIGTAVYCFRSLQGSGEEPNLANFTEEFKAWKGSKYSNEDINDVYKRVSPVLGS